MLSCLKKKNTVSFSLQWHSLWNGGTTWEYLGPPGKTTQRGGERCYGVCWERALLGINAAGKSQALFIYVQWKGRLECGIMLAFYSFIFMNPVCPKSAGCKGRASAHFFHSWMEINKENHCEYYIFHWNARLLSCMVFDIHQGGKASFQVINKNVCLYMRAVSGAFEIGTRRGQHCLASSSYMSLHAAMAGQCCCYGWERITPYLLTNISIRTHDH